MNTNTRPNFLLNKSVFKPQFESLIPLAKDSDSNKSVFISSSNVSLPKVTQVTPPVSLGVLSSQPLQIKKQIYDYNSFAKACESANVVEIERNIMNVNLSIYEIRAGYILIPHGTIAKTLVEKYLQKKIY